MQCQCCCRCCCAGLQAHLDQQPARHWVGFQASPLLKCCFALRCLLHSLHCLLHSRPCLLRSLHCLLHSLHCLLHCLYCLLNSLYCFLHSLHCLLHSCLCLLYSCLCLLHCLLHSLLCLLHSLLCYTGAHALFTLMLLAYMLHELQLACMLPKLKLQPQFAGQLFLVVCVKAQHHPTCCQTPVLKFASSLHPHGIKMVTPPPWSPSLSSPPPPHTHRHNSESHQDCHNAKVGQSADLRSRYEGPDCNMDINECLRQTVTCPANAGCINTEGAYNCTCWPGFNSMFLQNHKSTPWDEPVVI